MVIFVVQLVNKGYERDQAEEEKQWLSTYKSVRKFKEVCGPKR